MQNVYSGKQRGIGIFLTMPRNHPLVSTDMESTKPTPNSHRSIIYEDKNIYLFRFETFLDAALRPVI
jgi:hypothetical protein